MSKPIIVLDGKPSHGKVSVYGKMCEITPFIGIIKRDGGSFERGIGVKCPNQEKLVFRALQSIDPLHYIRAFKMLGELHQITDELVQDCVIATQPGSRLANFAKTKVYRECGIYKQSAFEDAQKEAFAFIPSKELIQRVTNGFEKHGASLKEKGSSGLPVITPTITPFVLAPEDISNPVSKIDPAKTGHFYKLLPDPQAQTA